MVCAPLAGILDKHQNAVMRISTRSTTVALTLLLLIAAAAIATLYPLATRPTFRPGDEAFIERAKADARANFRGADAYGRNAFPVVMRLSDRTCVELRSYKTDGAGSYIACYDRQAGKKIEEGFGVGF